MYRYAVWLLFSAYTTLLLGAIFVHRRVSERRKAMFVHKQASERRKYIIGTWSTLITKKLFTHTYYLKRAARCKGGRVHRSFEIRPMRDVRRLKPWYSESDLKVGSVSTIGRLCCI